MASDYILLEANDIRRGFDGVKPGWIMGSPFYAVDDLRHSYDFEIKEWDKSSIRAEWTNHADQGSEYIAILNGVLTVSLGRQLPKGIELESNIEVQSGQRIILREGIWRRFAGTDDVKGITIRKSADTGRTERLERYRSTTEHWTHTDQIRQWLLYNMLMASSVLVLGWSALYVYANSSAFLLVSLSVLGMICSAAWWLIVRRASGYFYMYEKAARDIERGMQGTAEWPFHQRLKFNSDETNGNKFKFAYLSQMIPLVFGTFYLVAFAYSIAR
jgi:hypothetical protein